MQICTVIPCYNEAERLPIQIFVKHMEQYPNHFFVFVNDGSSDTTLALLQQHFNSCNQVYVYSLQQNAGKAEAVRQGVLQAIKWQDFDCVGFMDADLATPLSEIAYLTNYFADNSIIDMVFGARIKRLGANIQRDAMRHYNGRIFATLTSKVLKGIPVYDTQCGAKFFRTGSIEPFFDRSFITKWLFDIEVIARVVKQKGRKYALEAIYEAPLRQWQEMGASKLTLKNMLLAPFELLQIKSHYQL